MAEEGKRRGWIKNSQMAWLHGFVWEQQLNWSKTQKMERDGRLHLSARHWSGPSSRCFINVTFLQTLAPWLRLRQRLLMTPTPQPWPQLTKDCLCDSSFTKDWLSLQLNKAEFYSTTLTTKDCLWLQLHKAESDSTTLTVRLDKAVFWKRLWTYILAAFFFVLNLKILW